MRRMFINQPSTLQEHHNLHGLNVLAESETESVYRVWFLEGNIHSMQLPRVVLSEGWTDPPKILVELPYRFRYRNGGISQGGFKTFEAAVENYMDCKHSGKYASLYSDLKDVVCVERRRDYITI